MSGGVDSSVAAYLLLKRGFRCSGATMKLFDLPEETSPHERSCCSVNDVNDARDTAFRLAFPHYVLNLKDDFKKDVIEKFIRVYEEGGTPNPCIDCNRYLKFKKLMLRARALEFDYIATGHYARVEKSGGRYLLLKGADALKDQSYVLYTMTQNELASVLFPLGGLTKNEVREIAQKQGFINAKKHDSQDICFVPDGDYGSFIETHTGKKFKEGVILDVHGNAIGRHRGHIHYTSGQRRGLGVSAPEALYVCAKSPRDNTVTLGKEELLYSKNLNAKEINLIACDSIKTPLRVTVKTRYMRNEDAGTVEQTGDETFRVEFEKPQRAVTPGQAVVLYDGDIVVGGGTIC